MFFPFSASNIKEVTRRTELVRSLVLSSHHMQLRVSQVERNKLHKLGKTLVEPQVVPPLHRHQVSKPLKTHENSM